MRSGAAIGSVATKIGGFVGDGLAFHMCMRAQCCAYGTGFKTAVAAVLCDTNFVKAISSGKQAVGPLETETVHGGALGCHFVVVNELTAEWQHFASKGLSDQSKIVFDPTIEGNTSSSLPSVQHLGNKVD